MRVLVVDDYAVLRRFVRDQLRRLGLTDSHEAGSGSEALSKLSTQPFDLVLVDWNMEPMSGPQLITEMRCRMNLPNIQIMLITGDIASVDPGQAQRMGVTEIVQKSQKLEVLRGALERLGVPLQ